MKKVTRYSAILLTVILLLLLTACGEKPDTTPIGNENTVLTVQDIKDTAITKDQLKVCFEPVTSLDEIWNDIVTIDCLDVKDIFGEPTGTKVLSMFITADNFAFENIAARVDVDVITSHYDSPEGGIMSQSALKELVFSLIYENKVFTEDVLFQYSFSRDAVMYDLNANDPDRYPGTFRLVKAQFDRAAFINIPDEYWQTDPNGEKYVPLVTENSEGQKTYWALYAGKIQNSKGYSYDYSFLDHYPITPIAVSAYFWEKELGNLY